MKYLIYLTVVLATSLPSVDSFSHQQTGKEISKRFLQASSAETSFFNQKVFRCSKASALQEGVNTEDIEFYNFSGSLYASQGNQHIDSPLFQTKKDIQSSFIDSSGTIVKSTYRVEKGKILIMKKTIEFEGTKKDGYSLCLPL